MADLKSLKGRINSIKKTQKITKAMKMVAASKLRRSREAAEASREYSNTLQDIISSQSSSERDVQDRNILYGVENPKNILLILVTSDRGLCGGLNSNLVKYTVKRLKELASENKEPKVFLVGKKGHDQFKAHFQNHIYDFMEGFSSRKINYSDAKEFAEKAISLFEEGEFDQVEVIYPKFKSAIAQEPEKTQLIPCEIPKEKEKEDVVHFEYEPSKEQLLEDIVPKNVIIQLFQAFLETFASEQGARMTAMDNAVNNCNELIKKLNLVYNRTRQAKITTELVEIISAAESI